MNIILFKNVCIIYVHQTINIKNIKNVKDNINANFIGTIIKKKIYWTDKFFYENLFFNIYF